MVPQVEIPKFYPDTQGLGDFQGSFLSLIVIYSNLADGRFKNQAQS